MNKKVLLIVGGVVLVCMLCTCVSVAGYFFLQTSKTVTSLAPTLQSAATELAPTIVAAQEQLTATVEPTAQVEATAAPTKAPKAQPTKKPAQPDAPKGDSLQEGEKVANRFLIALSKNKYDDAVALTDNKLRNDAGTAEQMRALVEDKGLDPSIWEWMTTRVDGKTVYLDGVVNFADKRRGVANVQVTFEDNEWRVNYLNLETSGATSDPGAYNTWTEDRTKEEVAFARGAADVFLLDWQDGDYDGVWLMTAQPMKGSMDNDSAKLQAFLTGLKITPSDWTWEDSHRIIEIDGDPHPVIELKATVNYAEGSSGPLLIQLKWEDGFWSVLYIDVKAN